MNLKEAFRYQNKLEALINECCTIMSREPNILRVETTYLRKKVMEGAENETVLETPGDYASRINDMIDFVDYLFSEKEKLSEAIHESKKNLPIDMDSQIGLNVNRQRIAGVFKVMSELRGSQMIVSNGGAGYRFNAEGNQVLYKCDAKKVKTINYDRNKVRALLAELNRTSDQISAEVDRCLVTSEVDYVEPFDVNEGFIDVFDDFCEAAG